MPNEFENENSPNLEIEDITNIDDLDALKEKYSSLASKSKEVGDKNRHLFERAKKAEGELKEFKSKDEPKAEPKKSDETLLKRIDSLTLRASGITVEKEVELFDKWKTETGREADSIIGNKIFQAELADLRTAQANQTATSDIKGESGSSGAKDTPEYWIAKATTNSEGKLMFPDDLPKDLKLRAAIAGKMMQDAKSGGKQFYNS